MGTLAVSEFITRYKLNYTSCLPVFLHVIEVEFERQGLFSSLQANACFLLPLNNTVKG